MIMGMMAHTAHSGGGDGEIPQIPPPFLCVPALHAFVPIGVKKNLRSWYIRVVNKLKQKSSKRNLL